MEPKDFKLAVLVSGRGSNLQAIIDSIERGELPGARVALVLSDVAEAPALKRASRHGIETRVVDPKAFAGKIEFNQAMVEAIQARGADLVCLAGFMRILGKGFIEAFRGRIVNIHPSLLPAFPGLHPQQQALDYGVKISGCTVHFVDETVDGGAVILQSAVPVLEEDDAGRLAARILEQEHLLYPRAIRLFMEGRLTLTGRKALIKEN
ncbi:MAG: phosphoribosylglycinamide formyltransferase [Nitrospinaceae bacterium]|jgi:phosphoribosylglycinamide formyltransferase-1|nr:MAG: phosphoribosylglycinamide formyltransferase [Nitrospinaceae bacterium]